MMSYFSTTFNRKIAGSNPVVGDFFSFLLTEILKKVYQFSSTFVNYHLGSRVLPKNFPCFASLIIYHSHFHACWYTTLKSIYYYIIPKIHCGSIFRLWSLNLIKFQFINFDYSKGYLWLNMGTFLQSEPQWQ